MKRARVVWPPYPYRAGFCITDDTDAATLTQVKLVYDFLKSVNLLTTKTVWAFKPQAPSGIPKTPPSTLRGITLEDPGYLDYCRALREAGYEIALHSASAGNNTREQTIAAFELLEREFGNGGTYICHAKNADNIYWEEKTAPDPLLRHVLSLYSKYRCFGEDEQSEYFWGDVCRQKVKQIRLFRTRNTNTLAFNPSMPYFDAAKPYVRGWFSATKRSFHDCTTPAALERLCGEFGLTVLYQYLHRYADPQANAVLARFREDAERLASRSDIFLATTSQIMERLRQIQSIFVAYGDASCHVINTGTAPVEDVQIVVPDTTRCINANDFIHQEGTRLYLRRIDAGLKRTLQFDRAVAFDGARTGRLDFLGRAKIPFGHGRCVVNLGDTFWSHSSSGALQPGAFSLMFAQGLDELRPMSMAGKWEQRRLFLGQSAIILRELLLRRRTVSYDKFLDADDIALENHDNW